MKRAIFLALVAAIAYLITRVIWFIRETLVDLDEVVIPIEEEAW